MFLKIPTKLSKYSSLPKYLATALKHKTKKALSEFVGLATNSKEGLKWLPWGFS